MQKLVKVQSILNFRRDKLKKFSKKIVGLSSGEFNSTKQAYMAKKLAPKNRYSTGILLMPFVLAVSGANAQSTSSNETEPLGYNNLLSNVSYADRWSGFYFGASVGGGWGNSSTFYDRAGDDHLTTETISPVGYLASVTAGYNYQLDNNIIIGIEGDLGMMNFQAPDKLDMWDGHIWKSKYTGLWGSLRPRVGYAFDNVMIYGTAGLSFMQTNEIILGDNDATQNTYNDNIHTGLVFGGGVEYALSDNLSAKIEYLQMQFPEYQSYTNNEELYGFTNSASVVRAGLNFKF